MYHFISVTTEHNKLVKDFTEQWKAQSESAFVNITSIMKNTAIYSDIIDQRGNNLALETKNVAVYWLISGDFPPEMQKIADNLEDYYKFESEKEVREFIEKIIKS